MRLIASVLIFVSAGFAADTLAPQIETVAPKVVKPGDTVTVTGISLGDNRVDEVYLTDHKFDMKVKVLEQSAKIIRFRVPPVASPGRVQLMMLLKAHDGRDPLLLELPAYILIEDRPAEIGQVQDMSKKPRQK